ncbi:hypothetical protein BN2475_1360009 [Paraburkholderia ribeironis]|uniref:GGDEF domain-containing protein n=1 Tax=Paraburkholderia ribeironis TaxID=1247936 RepID=A0A1N7SPQ0_9BURK|nr:hypothetical protein BN2475_1360009 [Paraburkholderia ribeironis]
MIVLPETDLHGASEIAGQACEAVMRLNLDTPTSVGYVTVSVGCAAIGRGSLSPPMNLSRQLTRRSTGQKARGAIEFISPERISAR